MSKAAVTSFIVDLKLTPDDQVKILELGPAFDYSMYSGYEALHEANPLEQHIAPLYKALRIPIWHSHINFSKYHPQIGVNIRETMGLMPVPEKPGNFNPENLQDYAVMIMGPRACQVQYMKMTENNLDHVLIHDGNAALNACYIDKAVFAAVMRDQLGDLLPRQKVYPILNGQIRSNDILNDFTDDDDIVLKLPDEARSIGVFITKRDLLARMNDIGLDNAYLKYVRGMDLYPKAAWHMIRYPKSSFRNPPLRREYMLVAQEKLDGKPVEHNDKKYDPTMRVLVTAWHDKGQTYIKCHDAYYKLPRFPIGFGPKRLQTVSAVKQGWLPWKQKIAAAEVPIEDKHNVFEQLNSGLSIACDHVFKTSSAEMVAKLIKNEDLGTKLAGFRMLDNNLYHDLSIEDLDALEPVLSELTQTSDEIKETLTKRVERRISYKTDPLYQYGVSEQAQNLFERTGLADPQEPEVI